MPSPSQILKNETLTFAEKAISLKALDGKKVQRTGDIAVVKIDLAMAQDSTGPLAIRVLEEMGINKLWNPKRVLLVIDHTYPAADEKVANLHALMRNFAFKHGCVLVEGSISHQQILEEYAKPGLMILGADSHTCQAGCVGAFATGVGSTEIAAIWATGQIWLRVPDSVRINLVGKLKKGVFARDIIQHFIGMVGEDGGNYRALEWKGGAVKDLSIASRACISNSSMECGAKIAVFEPDALTRQYLRTVERRPNYEIHAGKNAEYTDEFEIELNKLEPVVATPGNVDNVKAIEEVEGTPIDQAFVGSSTNGRLEDLQMTAKILKGRRVNPRTRCIVTPASLRIYEEAIRSGLVDVFLEAGAVFTNATCGACVGTHLGVLGENEVCISSSTRNFIGRMGSTSAKIYLASPATVAASAIRGKITDPRRYLR